MGRDRFSDFERVDSIFKRALELSPETRETWLQDACGRDTKLLARVRGLLNLASEESGTLAVGRGQRAAWADNPVSAGERFGPWRILEEVGRGGMAVVFRAERADGAYRQQAAIKLLDRTGGSASLEQRFERERSLLARLEHPNIARLLDGGTTEDGRSYIVMEYVEGETIDRWCDARRLSIDARLKLFLAVCDAVQFAHRQLIVHRDIKPGNILVTAEGVPKLLDFGIAKLLEANAEAGDLTRTGLSDRLLTPQYASPEQVLGEPVSTATDVHALGLLLYELLSGHRARSIDSSRPTAIERAVCETQPAAPSLVAATDISARNDHPSLRAREIAARRELSPAGLKRSLKGDLDNIVLVALRREPERRYASAEQLAEDVRRHLDALPVKARPNGVAYRADRFVRRHIAGVAMALAVTILISGTIGFYTDRLARERDAAEQAAEQARIEMARAEQVSGFLTDLFEAARPEEARGAEVTARDLLAMGVERAEELADQPEVQTRLLAVMGKTYHRLGMYAQAQPLYERTLETRQRFFGPAHESIAESLNDLGVLLRDSGDFEAAEPLLRGALAMRLELLGEAHEKIAESRDELGRLLQNRGDYQGAEEQFRAALAIRRQVLEEAHPDIALSLNSVSLALRMQGNNEEAEPYLREALEIYRQLYGDEHPWTTTLKANLALLFMDRGQWDEAEQLLAEVIAFDRRAMGPRHPELANRLNFMGSVYREQGRLQEAHAQFQEALEIGRASLEPGHPRLSEFLLNHAQVYLAEGDAESAEPLLTEAVQIRRESLLDGHWRTAHAQGWLGQALAVLGQFDEAESLLLESYATLSDQRGPDSPLAREVLERIVDLYESRNLPGKAEEYRALMDEGTAD